MTCPKCREKAFPFVRFFTILNPFRVVCTNCGARLVARRSAYYWTAFHGVLGIGIAWVWHRLGNAGRLDTGGVKLVAVAEILALAFVTAFVIPYHFFSYALEEPRDAG